MDVKTVGEICGGNKIFKCFQSITPKISISYKKKNVPIKTWQSPLSPRGHYQDGLTLYTLNVMQ